MIYQAFKKESFKQLIAYLAVFCFILTSQTPSNLIAQTYIYSDPECTEPSSGNCASAQVERNSCQRTKVAMVVAGATVLALLGGAAYAVSNHSSCHKHRHHSCYSSYNSCCYSRNSCNDCNDNCSDRCSDCSRNWSSDYCSDSHSFFSNSGSSSIAGDGISGPALDPQFFERGDLVLRGKQRAGAKISENDQELSGSFVLHPAPGLTQGNANTYVRLPDGNVQSLGHVSFSSNQGTSISYGPFTQKGTYTFGMHVEGANNLPTQSKIGSIEVNLNDSTVESHDFFVPAHAPVQYEPRPCEYVLK